MFLAVLGADRNAYKQLVALQEAMSESAGAWEDLFADLAARGLPPPELIVADGAKGLWSALTKAWSGVAQQRCWLHKIRNVEEKLPKEHQRAVHTDLSEAMHAETAPLARAKLDRLAKSYERRYPEAAACIRDDDARFLAYYRFPRATWIHLRKTNAMESIFAPIRNRTDAMKRAPRSSRVQSHTHSFKSSRRHGDA